MKLFIRMDFPPFFVNIFIFYVNIWIVNVCTECVVGMYFKKECIRVWNYGVEAIFFIYIGNYIILFVCFVALLLFFVFLISGVAATTFYIFCTLLFITFQLKAKSSCSNTQKAHLKPSDVKSPKPVRCSDAKSNVHSMNNIQGSESFSISVCHRIGLSAVRACGNF